MRYENKYNEETGKYYVIDTLKELKKQLGDIGTNLVDYVNYLHEQKIL